MAKNPRRLGRGLASLVSPVQQPTAVESNDRNPEPTKPVFAQSSTESEKPTQRTASVDLIDPNPFQPRRNVTDSDIVTLISSIRRNGILQPIAVRPIGDRYQIIAGERRWTAAKSLNLAVVPIIVHEANDEKMLELALIENLHREDLNPIDRARAYREFCDRFALKPEEVAQRLGEDRSTVTNYLRLLDLPEEIRMMAAKNAISMGHARCLLGIDGVERQLQLAQSVIENELSVRALEEIARRTKTRSQPESAGDVPPPQTPSAHIADMERRFEEALKTRVHIREAKRKGRGKIVIEYYSLDDFDRVVEKLGIHGE